MQHCPYCGADDYQLDSNCPNCGAVLPRPEPIQSPPPQVVYYVPTPPPVQRPVQGRPNPTGVAILTVLAIFISMPVLFMVGCVACLVIKIPIHNENVTKINGGNSASVASATKNEWVISEGKSKITGAKALTARLVSERTIDVAGYTARPELYCECTEGRLTSFVYIATRAKPATGYKSAHMVTLTFDEGHETNQYWAQSISNKILIALNATDLFGQFKKAKSLEFDFTPTSSERVYALFDLTSFDSTYQKLRKACPDKGK